MKNNFKNNKMYTIGVEEEYMICNPDNYNLIDKADVIMDSLDEKSLERFSYELLLSEIESNTSICMNVDDAIDEVSKLRKKIKLIGNRNNFNIGISGTHPTAKPDEQNFIQNDSYKWVRNELKYYASQNITFSTHVHIGVNDPELAINVSNISRCWIAPLLALSVNSPFFNGKLTGMQSSRTFQFGIFPRTNIAHNINNMKEYQNIINNYIASGSISKPRQIWWKIRPHIDFGTVEFRIFDVQRSLENTKMIVAICQALVHKIYKDLKDGKNTHDYNMEYLNDGLWKAASKGLNSTIINPINEKLISMKDMVNSLLEYIYPSLVYFGTENIQKTIENILINGTEADQQIKVFNKFDLNNVKKYLIENVEFNLGEKRCRER